MQEKQVALVIPTIRKDSFEQFMVQWGSMLLKCLVIVVEDNPNKTLTGIDKFYPDSEYYSWGDIDNELGKDSWIISRRNSGIRSYGFIKALQHKNIKYIISLDDDCYPDMDDYNYDFVGSHIENLDKLSRWMSTYNSVKVRGVPFENKGSSDKVMINHGMWTGNLDLDAITEINKGRGDYSGIVSDNNIFYGIVPQGIYFPMCSMNFSFKREVTPLMYMPPMGQGQPYDRFDDIWAGVFAKKICDHLGYYIKSGSPMIFHSRASDKYVNLKKECSGYKINEYLWEFVDKVNLTSNNFSDCYVELLHKLQIADEYWDKLREASKIWVNIVKNFI